jgi:hypothetical protein
MPTPPLFAAPAVLTHFLIPSGRCNGFYMPNDGVVARIYHTARAVSGSRRSNLYSMPRYTTTMAFPDCTFPGAKAGSPNHVV